MASFLHIQWLTSHDWNQYLFSSLSESGFIPTLSIPSKDMLNALTVLISFREWLHSYSMKKFLEYTKTFAMFSSLSESGFIPTKDKETLDAFKKALFSSLSESGFIPTQ